MCMRDVGVHTAERLILKRYNFDKVKINNHFQFLLRTILLKRT